MNVVEIIDALAEKFGIVVDWTNQNVIPYLQELMSRIVSYEIQTSVFWIVFVSVLTIGFGIASPILLRKALKQDLDSWTDWSETVLGVLGIVCTIFFVGMLIASSVVIPIQVMDIIKCNTIPEQVFIQYISQYIH